jgi:hypothetical protein
MSPQTSLLVEIGRMTVYLLEVKEEYDRAKYEAQRLKTVFDDSQAKLDHLISQLKGNTSFPDDDIEPLS